MTPHIWTPQSAPPPSPVVLQRRAKKRLLEKELRTHTGRILVPGQKGYEEIVQAIGIGCFAPGLTGVRNSGHQGVGGGGAAVVDFITDTFTGTNGTALQSHTSNDGGTWTRADLGLTQRDVTLNGSGFGVANSSAGTNCYIHSATPPSADYRAWFTWTTPNALDDAYVFVRSGSPNPNSSSYSFGFTPNLWKIRRNTTTLTSTSASISTATAYKIEIRISGTTITGYVDNVQVLTTTDSNISGAGLVAFYIGFGAAATSAAKISDFHAAA